MTDTEALRDEIALALNGHQRALGMVVSMGVTCDCGYWTGGDPEVGKRPLPLGRDGLDVHRGGLVLPIIAQREQALRAEIEQDILALPSLITGGTVVAVESFRREAVRVARGEGA